MQYDVVFNSDIVAEVFNGKGWELSFPNINESQQQEIANLLSSLENKEGILDSNTLSKLSNIIFPEEMLIACVVGLFDRGKTFVVNQLSEGNYESGLRYHTKGISAAKVLKGLSTGTLLLDTEGTNTPLDKISIDNMMKILSPFILSGKDPWEKGIPIKESRKRKEIYEEQYAKYFNHVKSKAIVNKKLTEFYKQSLIFELSDIIILVVNEMNWIDQQYIDSVNQLQQNKPNSTIIVIHNFKSIEKMEDFHNLKVQYVESVNNGEMKEEIINNSKSGEEEQGNNKVFVYRSKGKGNEKLYQLFLCKNGTEAGNRINEGTFKKIQQLFTTRTVGDRETFITHLLEAANTSLYKIVKDPGELYVSVKDARFFIHSNQKNPKFLQDDVEVSTECLLSLRSSTFLPNVDIIHYSNGDGMWIVVDLPGFEQKDLTIKTNKVTRNVIISGEKVLKFSKYSPQTKGLSATQFVRYDQLALQYENAKTKIARQFGQFSIPIHIPYEFSLDRQIVEMKNGTLTIHFPPDVDDIDSEDDI